MEFKDFLMKKYRIGEKSARDYVGRFNGIVARGIYKGENEITPSMKVAVEREFPNSKSITFLPLNDILSSNKKGIKIKLNGKVRIWDNQTWSFCFK